MPQVLYRLEQGIRRHRGWSIVLGLVLAVVGLAASLVLWRTYHYSAAQRALERRDLESAQRHLGACLRAWPRSAAIHLQAARVARRRDALEEARQHLTACQDLEGISSASGLEWMLLRAQEGDLDSVEGQLQSLVEQHHPDRVLILEALAKGYQTALRTPDVINALDALLELQPDHFQ